MAWSMALLGYPYGPKGDYWIGTLGGTGFEAGRSIAIDSSDNFYVVGETTSGGVTNNVVLLIKYNSDGVIQWQRTLGGTGLDYGASVSLDSTDNVYVTGTTSSPGGGGGSDLLLAKYSSSGSLQWQRTLGASGTEKGLSVRVNSTDSIYVVGETYSRQGSRPDLLIAKYLSNGNQSWSRLLGGTGYTWGTSVTTDPLDYVYALGYIRLAVYRKGRTSYLSQDLALIKYDSNGAVIWQRKLGGSSGEYGISVATRSSDNAYVAGYTSSNRLFLAKYDSVYGFEWQRTLGGTGFDRATSLAIDSSENLYLLGYTASAGAGSEDLLIAKYDSSGTIQWQRTLGGTGIEQGHAIALDSAENICIVGQTASAGSGGADLLIAKLPNDGSLTGTYTLNGVPLVYAASSLSTINQTYPVALTSLTSYSGTVTNRGGTLTGATANSLTQYQVGL
jgi:hypothetical protein